MRTDQTFEQELDSLPICETKKDGDSHPAPATESVQGTHDTAIGIAAAITLEVTIVLHAVGRTTNNDTGAPKSLATQAERAAAAKQLFLPARRHFFLCYW